MSREDTNLGRNFPWHSTVRSASLTGILTLTVLTYNKPVEITRLSVSEWRLCAAKDLRGSNIGILLERLANRQAEAP